MSGRKYTRVQLESRVNEFLGLRSQLEESLCGVNSFLFTIASEAKQVPQLVGKVEEVKQKRDRISELLSEVKNKDASSLMSQRIEEIEKKIRKLRGIKNEINSIRDACLKGVEASQQLWRLKEALYFLKELESSLKYWDGEDAYSPLEKKVDGLLKRTTEQISREGKIDKEIITGIQGIIDEINRSSESIGTRNHLDIKRNYIRTGLEQVCKELGFRQVECKSDNPNSPVELVFDTYTNGLIRFSLALDGRVNSVSEIYKDNCGGEYKAIGDKLKETFGMKTDFRYQDNNEPVYIEKDARDLPSDTDEDSNEESKEGSLSNAN